MNSDSNLKHDVEQELRWDPKIQAEKIGVTVNGYVVQLDGQVDSLYEKWAADTAALRVQNVKAVANEIQVAMLPGAERADADIARAAINQLDWNYCIPTTVKTKVSNGWVTFQGTVDAQYQKDEAEKILHSLKGIKGIVNEIEVRPKINCAVVKENIVSAFERSAALDAKNITVESDAGTVTLRGTVRTWAERNEACNTAWSDPGVTGVENLLTIDLMPWS